MATWTRTPDGDGEIRQASPTSNLGTLGTFACSGRVADGNRRRDVLYFDLTAFPDTGASISAASLVCTHNAVSGTPTIEVYRMTQAGWIEGDGGGTPNYGATWNTYDGANNWTAAGGDWDTGTLYDSYAVLGTENVTFSNMLAIVQDAINTRASKLFILLKKSVETTTASKTMKSREDGTSSNWPLLTLTYTPSATGKPKNFMHLQRLRRAG